MISQNLLGIRKQIRRSCLKTGRQGKAVLLLAASKDRSVAEIEQVYQVGIRVIGENRIQEMRKKLTKLPADLRMDFIGHLQTNKVKLAVQNCYLIQAVDSLRLAQAIDKQAEKSGKVQEILLEVNVSAEASKFGFQPGKDFEEDFKKIMKMKNIKIKGLMTMEPYSQNPEAVRPFFRALRRLRDKLEKKFKIRLPELSMGMSESYSTAIEEGATIIRLGRALFEGEEK